MSALVTPTTRERLLEAASERLEAGGYTGASVLAVARGAGLAAGTLYRHFPSKAEMLLELFRSVYERELEAATAAAAGGEDAVERVELVVATFADRALRRPRLTWALIAEPVDPIVDIERLVYRRRYVELVRRLIELGVERGELPAQDAELTAAALVGGVGEALVGPTSPLAERPPDAARIVEALRAFVRRALGAGS
jgi:AcrR family transcriptional regulator